MAKEKIVSQDKLLNVVAGVICLIFILGAIFYYITAKTESFKIANKSVPQNATAETRKLSEDLKIEVRYNGSSFKIKNNKTVDLEDCWMRINSSTYGYSGTFKANDSTIIRYDDLKSYDLGKFDPSTTKIDNLYVDCSLSDNGFAVFSINH